MSYYTSFYFLFINKSGNALPCILYEGYCFELVSSKNRTITLNAGHTQLKQLYVQRQITFNQKMLGSTPFKTIFVTKVDRFVKDNVTPFGLFLSYKETYLSFQTSNKCVSDSN